MPAKNSPPKTSLFRRLLCPALAGLSLLAASGTQATPVVVESEWTLAGTMDLADAQAAAYNSQDGMIYAGRRGSGGSDGIYRISLGGPETLITTADRPADLAVDPATGDLYFSEDGGGVVYRTALGTTGREAWLSGLGPGEDDPFGLAFPPAGYAGAIVGASEALLVDRGWLTTPEAVWRFSSLTPENEFLLHPPSGDLSDPLDVAITDTQVFLIDSNHDLDGILWELSVDGSVQPIPTTSPLPHPIGLVADPLTQDLLVLDSGLGAVLRVDPASGAVSTVVSGLVGPSLAGIDISPDGSHLVVTDRAVGQIHLLLRDAVIISAPAEIEGTIGSGLELPLEGVAGTAPYQWTILSGALPEGLSLSPDGVISGVPVEAGSFSVTVKLEDSAGLETQRTFFFEILLSTDEGPVALEKIGTSAVIGRDLHYFIVLENRTDDLLPEVMVMDLLDPALTFLDATPTVETRSKNMLVWRLTNFQPRERRFIRFRARPDHRIREGRSIFANGACANLDPAFVYGARDTAIACEQQCDPLPWGPEMACEGACGAGVLLTVMRTDLAIQAAECGGFSDVAHRPEDPNEKLVLQRRYIQPDQELTYFIHYENIGDAEARDVFLEDVLEADLDPTTVRAVASDGITHDVADGETAVLLDRPFSRVLEGEINGAPFEIELPAREIHAVSLSGTTLSWDLLDVDLAPRATDHVTFKVRPKPGLPAGTVIENDADIRFEIFETLTTPVVENVIDDVAPTSFVHPLPPSSPPIFLVSWNGSDTVGEIVGYSLFVSVDGAPFTRILDETRASEFVFEGEPGRQYAFASVAVDSAGNREVKVPSAEAVTTTDLPPTDDPDGDGVLSSVDNCPFVANAGQEDIDGDFVGDACDAQLCGNSLVESPDQGLDLDAPGVQRAEECDDGNSADGDGCSSACTVEDFDGDGIADAVDSCPLVANPTQADTDGDGFADACDNCPTVADLTQADLDLDGSGDACDLDDDADGVADQVDNCPRQPNGDQLDGDGDGLGDVCDLFADQDDTDLDGLLDGADNCPLEANPGQHDEDRDGIGDACDDASTLLRPTIDLVDSILDLSLGGLTDVVIFGSSELNVYDIFEPSVIFGPAEAQVFGPVSTIVDRNGDGHRDLVLTFDVASAGFEVGATRACIFGETMDSTAFEGCDDVTVVGGAPRF